MKFIKWRKREKIKPIYLQDGDSIEINYQQSMIGSKGKLLGEKHTLIKSDIGMKMTIDEVGIFDAEVEGREAIGGVIINEKVK